MAVERTLSIIRPDATRRNLTGKVNAKFEEAGLRIVAQRRIKLTREQAEAFYGVHRERPLFDSLCSFMTSDPVVVQVLEGEGAVAKNREVMGGYQPRTSRSRNDSQGFCRVDRSQFGSRIGFGGECSPRDRVLFQPVRHRRLNRTA